MLATGQLAAQAADAVTERYDAPVSLSNWLARAYELRGQQIRVRLQQGTLPLGEQMSLLGESVRRDSQAFGLRTKCLALARNPDQLGGCGPR
jgi:hypothetical protein